MTSAEVRLLRFIHAASAHAQWVPYTMIKNTDALLPGDEKALSGLSTRGLIEEAASRGAYRVTERGLKDPPGERTASPRGASRILDAAKMRSSPSRSAVQVAPG